MRISDWSSDVCSSDLERNVDSRGRTMRILPLGCALLLLASAGTAAGSDVNVDCDVHSDYDFALTSRSLILTREDGAPTTVLMRSEERRVGKAWGRPCQSRWGAYH